MNTLLIDIDHTIFDAAWRDDMINNNDWDAYHLAGKEDKPIQEIVELINTLSQAGQHIYGYAWEVVALTARPGKWRKQTMDMFLKYNVSIDEILMRPDDNFRSAAEMKIELIKEYFGEDLGAINHNVILIDDNDKVIEAVRALGITTLHISAAKRRT